ncbi:MAG: NAD+ synthase [Prochloron sp. SP5CPC1]|nr:NAD+ synthase [Candidatus Paraprochloron terpiosi SP5CPC1]
MKIAIAQLNPTIGNLTTNSKKILAAAEQAAKEGVHLLLTPELSLWGYPPRDLLQSPGFLQSAAAQLQELAQQLPRDLAVLVGTVEKNPQADNQGEKPLYNSIALLTEGKIAQIFHKRLLPTYDVFDEHRYFAPGKENNCFSLAGVKIGVTICEDLWNDEEFWGRRSYQVNPIADLAKLELDLIVNLSASPYSLGKQKLREAMLGHGATRYQIPIIYANQVGGNDDLIFDGGSVAFNPTGEIACRAQSFQTDLVILEFNPNESTLHSKTITPIGAREEEEIWSALVLGVRDYAQKCGFSQVVLGLSGGIDSALVAAIAAEAMGAVNVLGVLMPSPYSSDDSITDAMALVKNLGIRSEKLAIGEAMTVYDKVLEPLFTGTTFGVAEENIQSRIRGTLLMAITNKFGYLLLSTGNKSEMAVGYCTLYGDMNGGLGVIADLPKTKVFDVCRWLNRHGEIIPPNIIAKPPSAELKPNQMDQDSLPPYEVLDDIIHRIIHQFQSPSEILAAGYELAVVNKVIKLVTRAEFKRRQAPPGLKITDCAFGTGWRMPIARV